MENALPAERASSNDPTRYHMRGNPARVPSATRRRRGCAWGRVAGIAAAVVLGTGGGGAATPRAARAVSSAATSADAAPLWPVPLPPAISSNFCEYREGHLHAGIDIRTFGRRGIPCRSPEAGWIARVRASYDGYGRALYVRTRSGRTLVFAHLDEFAPEIERRVREVQRARGRYRVDLMLPPGRVPVAEGDTVGWSGRTGTDAPHLHFEVRDAREHPLNPMRHGFAPPDTTAPVFGRVRLVPLSPGARVEGACLPGEWTARRVRGDAWSLDGPVRLRGPVGVEVELHDRLNAISGRLAPRRLRLELDGRTIARLELERFRFGHTDQVEFLYDMAAVRTEKAWFYLLFDRPGASMWGRRFEQGGRLGTRAFGRGTHEVRVIAEDAAGNAAVLRFVARVGGAPGEATGAADPPARPATDAPGLWALGELFCARRGAGAPPWPREGAVSVDSIAWVATAASLGPAPRVLPLGRGPGAPRIALVGLRAGEPRSIRFDAFDVELVVAARSLRADQVLWVTDADTRMPTDDGSLVPRSRRVRLGPSSLSLGADVELRFTGAAWDSTDAIYRLGDHEPRWSYYESVRDGIVLSTTLRRPGVYAVFADRTPPALRRAYAGERIRHADGARVPQIVVPVDDTGSGVDAERCVVRVDGRSRVFRWDFVDKKLFVELDDGNIIGAHRVEVEAYDRAGNRATRVDTVSIPRTR